MTAVFGKSIKREFYPEDYDGQPVSIASLSPTIYLFLNEPSYSEATTGTNALQTVSAWDSQSTASPYKCAYTFTAVDDPYPESEVPSRGYWEVINAVLQTGEPAVPVKRYFDITRIKAPEARPGTSLDDLKAAFPDINNYANDNKLNQVLPTAEEELRSDVEASGVVWDTVGNIPKTRLALAYKALVFACMGQLLEDSDRHEKRSDFFERLYRGQLKKIAIRFDSNEDKVIDAVTNTGRSSSVIMR